MDFTHLSNHDFLNSFSRVVKSERKIIHLVLLHVNESERRKIYAELGYESNYKFLVGYHGYSGDAAYDRVTAAKVLLQVPEVAHKLEEGALTLTQLKQVQQCVSAETKAGRKIEVQRTSEILEKIENKNGHQTKLVLSQEFNIPVKVVEILRPQQDESIRVETTFTREQYELIQEAKNSLSHSLNNPTLAEVFAYLATAHVAKLKGKDRSQDKAKRKFEGNVPEVSASLDKEAAAVTDEISSNLESADLSPNLTQDLRKKRKRAYLRLATKRLLFKKAGFRCEYRDPLTDKRCECQSRLQVDHIVPLACGGEEAAENLRVLCQTHNLHMARKWGLSSPHQVMH